jgi:hypothetical protein
MKNHILGPTVFHRPKRALRQCGIFGESSSWFKNKYRLKKSNADDVSDHLEKLLEHIIFTIILMPHKVHKVHFL